MEVILLEKVHNLGALGDKKFVKAGYGRNYLIPFAKAVLATKKNIVDFEARRAELEAKAVEVLKAAQKRAEKLKDLSITIEALASEEGKLFGSIGTKDIANAIAPKAEVKKNEIRLPNGVIRVVGEYDIDIDLHSDIVTTVKVTIVGKTE